MKKVYSHENRFLVWNVKNTLEENGIACVIRNEYIGGAAGDLSPLDAWPEVWVINDGEYLRAMGIVNNMNTEDTSREDWTCGGCGEVNDPSFESCWQCGGSA